VPLNADKAKDQKTKCCVKPQLNLDIENSKCVKHLIRKASVNLDTVNVTQHVTGKNIDSRIWSPVEACSGVIS
jgi:hypothetical protein